MEMGLSQQRGIRETWNILIVDDDEEDYILSREMLKEARGRAHKVTWAPSYEAGLEGLETEHYDAVLVDYDLGLHSGIALIREANKRGVPTPLILFTGRGNYDVDVEAMQAGATLYLSKGEANPLLLERAIRYAIERKQAEEALRKSEERFQKAFNASPNAQVISRQEDGYILAVNASFEQMFGYTRQEALGKTTLELNLYPNPADRDEFVRRLQADNTVRDFALEMWSKTGQIRQASLSAEMIAIHGENLMLTVIQDTTERKQMEETLRLSEERYRVAVINGPGIYAHVDRELRYRWIHNPHPDFKASEVIGKRDDELEDNADTRKLISLKQAVLDSGKGIREEWSIQRSDGMHTYDMTIEPLLDGQGQVVGVTTAAFDITARKQLEQALRESERQQRELSKSLELDRSRLTAVLDNLPVGVWIADQSGHLIGKNEQADRIWAGKAPLVEDVASYPQYTAWFADTGKLLQPEDYPVARALRTGQPVEAVELRIRRFDGSEGTVLVSAAPIRDRAGRQLGVVGVNLDISDRKRVQERLRASEERLSEFLENTQDIFFALDRDWRYTYVNRRFCELLGREPQEIIGSGYDELPPLYAGALVEQTFRRVFTQKTAAQFQFGDDDTGRWFEVSVYPSRDGILVFGRDRSEQHQAAVTLTRYAEQLARSNQDLEKFAIVASHDLQEPLRKIVRFGEMLERKLDGALDESSVDLIARMRAAAGRMQVLIDDLLALSQVGTHGHPFETVDLNRTMQEVLSDLEDQIEQTQGRVQVDPLPEIEADALQMRQLLQNLVGNALKFHQPGQPPVVRVSAQVNAEQSTVSLSVADNGIGFDMRHFERILEPFQRLHSIQQYKGTGMGMAICTRIVERHGGQIEAQSKPGEGSTFTVRLPLTQSGKV